MNSPHTLREVFVCLDAPTNRPPLQAFDCSPLGRSDRPPSRRATSAPTLRPPALWAFVLRFTASARPPLQAFDLRRGRLRGDLPPLRLRLWQGRFGRLCLPPLLGWCSVSAPLRPCQKRKLQKALPFTIFFPTKTPLIQQFILILRCK